MPETAAVSVEISPDIYNSKILIVDDLQVNILLLSRILSAAGYTSLSSTQTPQEVCLLHSENHYDLIVLDLMMPGMNGFEVMEGLKLIEPNSYLPILVITAEPSHKLHALNSGATDFLTKPIELPEVLARVRNLLEVRLLHRKLKVYSLALEQKIDEVESNRDLIAQQRDEVTQLYEQLVMEQARSERLLLNVLPQSIVERLKEHSIIREDRLTDLMVDSFTEATVLFADIVGFTHFAQSVSAEALVNILNDIFTRFDRIADMHGIEKIKTIGDAYMAVAGLPLPVADHARRICIMALDMLKAMKHFNQENQLDLHIRIGIDTGAVVAGVIGTRKFLYDLWGDVVNTASRMESHGLPGRIQITDATRSQLNKQFKLENRGVIEIKGKGEMHTWFLNGCRPTPVVKPKSEQLKPQYQKLSN